MTETSSQINERILTTYFPSWWDKSNNLSNLFLSYSEEFEELYTNFTGLRTEIDLDTMSGSFLDAFAKLFKLARGDGETDASLRSKVKAYWQAITGGATPAGIINAIGLLIGIDTSLIDVDEQNSYYSTFVLDPCEENGDGRFTATDDANNLTVDAVTYYEGAACINFDANAGTDITLTRTPVAADDFSDYETGYYLGFKMYIPNILGLTHIQVVLTDGAGATKTYLDYSVVESGWQKIHIELENPNSEVGTFDWTDVVSIDISAIYNGAVAYTDFRVDEYAFETYDYNMRIKIDVTYDGSFDLSLLNNVSTIVDSSKAAGIYYGGDGDVNIYSEDDIFLVNLSEYNEDDEIL